MSGSSALLIVDVQAGFVNDATKHIVPVVEALQTRYDYVYATRFINARDSAHRKWIDWHRFSEGTAEVELAFETGDNVVVIDKTVYTCINDSFLSELRTNGISEIHICGIDTDACVLKCAVDLFEAGIRPIVLANACASHAGSEFHDYGLQILRRLIGKRQIDAA